MKEIPQPDENNVWRLKSPGGLDSPRSPRPDAENKYFIVSTDGHVQEPFDLWLKRMDEKYRDRLPGVAIDKQGRQVSENRRFSTTPVSVTSSLKAKMACAMVLARPQKSALKIWLSMAWMQRSCFRTKASRSGRLRMQSSVRRCAGSTTTGRGRHFRTTTIN